MMFILNTVTLMEHFNIFMGPIVSHLHSILELFELAKICIVFHLNHAQFSLGTLFIAMSEYL